MNFAAAAGLQRDSAGRSEDSTIMTSAIGGCKIGASYRRHTRVRILAVVLVLCLSCGMIVQPSHGIPEVCGGVNPLKFDGIAAVGSQEDAEHSLGVKLNLASLELIHIYCTLQIGNVTYAPGLCPGRGLQPGLRNSKWGPIPLAFAYGKPGSFARVLISLKAPVRQLSLGVLSSEKEAWRAVDNQTFRLALINRSWSLPCWSASTIKERKSLLHRVINVTLTDILHKVNKTTKWLPGSIFVRGGTGPKAWPYPFHSAFIYEECENPAEQVSLSNLSYTVCSRWNEVTIPFSGLDTALIHTMNVLLAIAAFMIFVLCWPWLHGAWYNRVMKFCRRPYKASPDSPFFEVRNTSQRLSSSTERVFYIRDEDYPEQLKVKWLLVSRRNLDIAHRILPLGKNNNQNIRLLNQFSSLLPLGALGVLAVVWLLLIVGINLRSVYMFGQPFDSAPQLWSPCSQSGYTNFIIISTVLNVICVLTILAVSLHDLIAKGHTVKRGWNGHLHRQHPWIWWPVFTLSFALAVAFPIVALPVFITVIIIVGYTVIGLAVFQFTLILGLGTFLKLFIFNILRIRRFDSTILGDIDACKIATDIASRDLSNSFLNEITNQLARNFENTRKEKPPSSTDPGNDRKQSLTDTGFVDKTGFCTSRAFLLLCLQSGIVSCAQTWDSVDAHPVPGDANDPIYATIWALLVMKVWKRLRRFLVLVAVKAIVALAAFVTIEVIVTDIGKLTPLARFSGLIVPGIVLLQALCHFFLASPSHDRAVHELVLRSKGLHLKLLEKIGNSLDLDQDGGAILLEGNGNIND